MSDDLFPRALDPALRFLAQGASARLYVLGQGEVVKLFHPAVSDEMIEREAHASRLAAELGMPAIATVRRITMEGTRGLVYPRVAGVTLLKAMRRRPWSSGAMMPAMARLQARMHQSPEIEGVRSLKDVLRTDILHGPASDVLKEWALVRLKTMPDGRRLLHGDFHVENIMVAEGGFKVIDWSKAALGDPAADAARTEMLMRFGAGPQDRLTVLAREWATRRWRAAYLRESGMAAERLDSWRAVVAVAWLRARKPVRERAFREYLHDALKESNYDRASA
ncbi:phosphotransferase family protein [Sphingobium cloacae]|uniref:Aminoglycoside phosphotransferase domain-containing protein n=1 Tax=Sphingobium cloacae TaxID=120107 RepID=A0A1E1F5R7_9SPHN|nr:aminoglycoside phosphotransferase family protein [Sphingobium cloacae]BAV65849.1 hypothetical protein SCLO_1028090 [Sphingobium cloacae]